MAARLLLGCLSHSRRLVRATNPRFCDQSTCQPLWSHLASPVITSGQRISYSNAALAVEEDETVRQAAEIGYEVLGQYVSESPRIKPQAAFAVVQVSLESTLRYFFLFRFQGFIALNSVHAIFLLTGNAC